MARRSFVSSIFEHPAVSSFIAPIGRRDAVRKFLFGSGVAALTPLLEGSPGVSAASLGYHGSGEVRLLQLTGKALARELARLEATSEFHRAADLLATQGFSPGQRTVEGLQVFIQSGQTWTASTSLTLHYRNHLAAATLHSYVGADQESLGLILFHDGGQTVGEVYEARDGRLTWTGRIEDQGDAVTIQQPGLEASRSMQEVGQASHAMA